MEVSEYILGREELVLLTWLLKYPTLPGLGEKPLADANPGQVEVMLATAERSLQARGWLELNGPGEIRIDPELASLLQVCGDPDVTLWFAHRSLASNGEVSHFYFKHQLIVRHSLPKPGIHRLAVLSSLAAVHQYILSHLFRTQTEDALQFDTDIADSLIVAARDIGRETGLEAAQAMLVRNGIESDIASALAELLVNPISESSLIGRFRRAAPSNLTELMFVEWRNGMWLFEPAFDEPGVYLTRAYTVNEKEVAHKVERWLEKMLGSQGK